MALAAYQQLTQALLDDPTNDIYSPASVTQAINIGRAQIAGATQSIRYTATISTSLTEFSLSTLSVVAGVQTAFVPLQATRPGALLEKRPWEWFFQYYLTPSARPVAPPARWSMQSLGSPGGGTIWLDPIPDTSYLLSFDSVGLPLALASDGDPEAIPYPWTDAIPYFAAYLLYQDKQRTADAVAMLQRWGEFMSWGTRQVVSTVLPLYMPGGPGTQEASRKILNTGFPPQQQPAAAGR